MKKIAVIGAGGIAQSVHFPSLKEIAGFQVQAVCDVAAGRAQQAAAQFPGAAWYDNYRVMLEREELDGVFVLVQPDQSFRIAADSMRAGLHVFCEKPAGITLFQLESLERLQREKGVVLQVGFNRRFIPLVQKVAELMAPLGPSPRWAGASSKTAAPVFTMAAPALWNAMLSMWRIWCAALPAAMVNFKAAYRYRTNGPEAAEAAWTEYWTTGRNACGSWKAAVDYLKSRSYEGIVCMPAEYSDEPNVETYTAEDLAYLKGLFGG